MHFEIAKGIAWDGLRIRITCSGHRVGEDDQVRARQHIDAAAESNFPSGCSDADQPSDFDLFVTDADAGSQADEHARASRTLLGTHGHDHVFEIQTGDIKRIVPPVNAARETCGNFVLADGEQAFEVDLHASHVHRRVQRQAHPLGSSVERDVGTAERKSRDTQQVLKFQFTRRRKAH